MKLASLGLATALGLAPVAAHAQVTVTGGVSFNFGAMPGESVGSVDVFFDQLAPYGVWVDDPVVGQVFVPDQPGYVPYQNGHWQYTDVGFVWVSDEPFAWATSHYGRWWFSPDYGRWVWVPDTVWGPSWVNWYEADGTFGWAPIAPAIVLSAGYTVPLAAYHFAPADRLLDANVRRYYVPRARVAAIRSAAQPIAHTETVNNHRVVTGPSPERLQAARITPRPVRASDAKAIGRLNASDAAGIEQRARERRPEIERQNQQRLDQNAELRRAAENRAAKAPENRAQPEPNRQASPQPTPPQRTEPTRPEPQRTEPTRPEPKTEAPPPAQQRTEPTHEPRRTEPTPPPKTEAPRPEPQHNQPPPPEPKTEAPRAEPQHNQPPPPEPKTEAPRAEPQHSQPPPKTEAPRAEPQHSPPPPPEPKTEAPRPEPQHSPPPGPEPKAEAPRPEPQHTQPPPPEPKTEAPHSAPNATHAQPPPEARTNEDKKQH
jgi:hypothetical protein